MKSSQHNKELRTKKVGDLTKLVESKKTDLLRAKLDLEFGKDKNVAQFKKIKREIAQIETIITEMVIEAASAQSGKRG